MIFKRIDSHAALTQHLFVQSTWNTVEHSENGLHPCICVSSQINISERHAVTMGVWNGSWVCFRWGTGRLAYMYRWQCCNCPHVVAPCAFKLRLIDLKSIAVLQTVTQLSLSLFFIVEARYKKMLHGICAVTVMLKVRWYGEKNLSILRTF